MRRLEGLVAHVVLVTATLFAIYPLLWVITLALSPVPVAEARLLPIVSAPSLDNFRRVLGLLSGEDATALFLRQVANSLLVSLTTAAAAILVATPTAYAL